MPEGPFSLSQEADSLPIHVEMCALRQRMIMDKLDRIERSGEGRDARLTGIYRGVWAVAAGIAGIIAEPWLSGGVAVARSLMFPGG